MPVRNSKPPATSEIGDRIVRNLDRVRGFMKILQDEIHDPQKLAPAGDRKVWQDHSEKLDGNLSELRDIITGMHKDGDS